MSEQDESERLWEEGWEGHSMAQLRRMSKWTLSQKLDWLEEAQRLVQTLQAGRAKAAENARTDRDS